MDWITDFLKHLAITRSIVAAVFITTLVMVIGPHLFPAIVPSTPQPWSPVLFGVMVLSGVLLIFWAVNIIYSAIVIFLRADRTSISPPNLNNNHYELVLVLGENPSQPLCLDNINYNVASFTKLEIMQWVLDLKSNSLVSTNSWNENLISLTQEGRTKALEIQKRRKLMEP
jgi:hypothetical protein